METNIFYILCFAFFKYWQGIVNILQVLDEFGKKNNYKH
jgi:hypothetical protein